MDGAMFDRTKVAAYYLWDHTGCESALDLWYCAEDLACYFEQMGIFTISQIETIRRLGVYNPGYVEFIRHVAFRIHVYTEQYESEKNWYAAERLLQITDWLEALIEMANIYRNAKTNQDFINDVRSDNIRAFYEDVSADNKN